MREIKFRAWDKKTKVMLLSNHNITENTFSENCFEELTIGFDGLLRDCDYEEYYPSIRDVKDDDYVLMQYIGLKDKNGKEIYEGDIVKAPHTQNVIIKYEAYYTDEEYGGTLNIGFCLGRPDIEVIGNIYENPELLDESDKNE